MPVLTEPNLSGRGKREDLMDMIALVDAKDTPFTSMAKKGSKPGNMFFRWQSDSLPTPEVGGVPDGLDVNLVSGVTKAPPARTSGSEETKAKQQFAKTGGSRDGLTDLVKAMNFV